MKIATMQANEGNRFYWHQLDKLQYKSLDLLWKDETSKTIISGIKAEQVLCFECWMP